MKKKQKPKKKNSDWLANTIAVAISGVIMAFIVMLIYYAGRSSKAAEMSVESQEFSYMHYWIDGTHYINFYTRVGGMSTVNFTLDSIKKEMLRPQPIEFQIMPIDTLKWKD